jgi:Flp pilus assembly protein TadB
MKTTYHHTEGDSRLLYGVGVPFLLATALIIAVLLTGSEILVIPMMLVVVALTAVVVWGFGRMIAEDENQQDS